jgi:hypothetical protein
MIVMRGDGRRTADIAAALAGHPQPVRARLARCNAAGFAGWRDRPRAGRARWLTEAERSPLRGSSGRDCHPSPAAAIPLATTVEEWRVTLQPWLAAEICLNEGRGC